MKTLVTPLQLEVASFSPSIDLFRLQLINKQWAQTITPAAIIRHYLGYYANLQKIDSLFEQFITNKNVTLKKPADKKSHQITAKDQDYKNIVLLFRFFAKDTIQLSLLKKIQELFTNSMLTIPQQLELTCLVLPLTRNNFDSLQQQLFAHSLVKWIDESILTMIAKKVSVLLDEKLNDDASTQNNPSSILLKRIIMSCIQKSMNELLELLLRLGFATPYMQHTHLYDFSKEKSIVHPLTEIIESDLPAFELLLYYADYLFCIKKVLPGNRYYYSFPLHMAVLQGKTNYLKMVSGSQKLGLLMY